MLDSPPLSSVLTALFVLTGAWALVRIAHVATGRGPDADPVAESSHLLMSVVMIAMTWAVVGDPRAPVGVAALAAFALVAAASIARLVRPGHRPRVVAGYHLLMAAAMSWMVAAMPATTMPAMTMPGTTGTAAVEPVTTTWVTAVTWVTTVLLVAAAACWALAAARITSTPCAAAGSRVEEHGGGGGTAVLTTTALTSACAPTWLVRVDACCHVLMSLGMAGMFVAML